MVPTPPREFARPIEFTWPAAIATGFAFSFGAVSAQMNEPIKPIPIENHLPAAKVELGKILFNDKRFSKDNSISCASCHNLEKGGADKLPLSIGIGGAKGAVNSPTVLNSGFNFRQFWDGRANSLEEQMVGPIHDPKEMGSNWQKILSKLAGDTELDKRFKAAYGSGATIANIQDALANFQRDLTTPNSRFDRYLMGDKKSLSADEIKGYQLFKNYGCVACHQGVNVGGNMFQTFGVMGDYFKNRGNVTNADMGRYNITKKDSDKHVFKVPSLRNVALTAPYFHDGSAKNLREAIEVMFQYQLGRSASDEDKQLIEKFLITLTGEFKGRKLEDTLKSEK
ncbi:cytochrome-c peroxidase [Delftia lacustris]|uniref:cytochrome-c peroxidase n=1 Tax=Delftia lacustris TaxID=558537 RepID=UPI0035A64F98